MSTFKSNCGIPYDFEGFQNCRAPKDLVVFFDDFLGASWSSTADAAVWKQTLVETQATTAACLDGTNEAADEGGGILNLVTDATVAEGNNLQVNGELFHLEDGYPLYYEARINIGDVSNVEALIGLASTDAEILTGGMAAGGAVGFLFTAAVLYAHARETTSLKSVDTGITEADDDWIRVAFFWDGDDKCVYSVDSDDNGVFDYVTTLTQSTAAHYLPCEVMLTPTIEVVTGATATAEKMYVDYVLCMQTRFKE